MVIQEIFLDLKSNISLNKAFNSLSFQITKEVLMTKRICEEFKEFLGKFFSLTTTHHTSIDDKNKKFGMRRRTISNFFRI